MRILVVDDQPMMIDLWRRFLTPLDVPIITAKNLVEALDAMKGVPPPDLVLLDLHMPGTSAENTMAHIITIKEHNPNALVVILTGLQRQDLEQLAKPMQADEFLLKNEIATQTLFLSALKRVFNSPRGKSLAWTSEIRKRLNEITR